MMMRWMIRLHRPLQLVITLEVMTIKRWMIRLHHPLQLNIIPMKLNQKSELAVGVGVIMMAVIQPQITLHSFYSINT